MVFSTSTSESKEYFYFLFASFKDNGVKPKFFVNNSKSAILIKNTSGYIFYVAYRRKILYGK